MTGEGDRAILYPEELVKAKAYMHAEDDDLMVTSCVLSARAYLAHACGVSLPPPGTSRREIYDVVCHALAADAYDRRSTVITGAAVAVNPVFRDMKNHLKLTEPAVSDLGADKGGGDGNAGQDL